MIPEIVQDWNDDRIQRCCLRDAPLYSSYPTIGLVVGTFAAVPYIHLQLEARRRFFPQIPLLIHDDASNQQRELKHLCDEYGADFETNRNRQPPCVGDLTAVVGGLFWGKQRQLDIVLKVSRRWIFLAGWSTSLTALAYQSQYATFSSFTSTFNFGFRTECFGMSVASWMNPLAFGDLVSPIHSQQSVFVEAFIHGLARRLESVQSEQADFWRLANPMTPDKSGYALWTLMGTDRCQSSMDYLWHDCNQPRDYFQAAQDWGLPYSEQDFADPNQGQGNGT